MLLTCTTSLDEPLRMADRSADAERGTRHIPPPTGCWAYHGVRPSVRQRFGPRAWRGEPVLAEIGLATVLTTSRPDLYELVWFNEA